MELEYTTRLAWQGSTAAGYRAYDRDHEVTTTSTDALPLTAAPEFRGSRDRLNPEQLVVAAASSCQLLSFLAVAARAGVDVVGYEDDARGVLARDADGRTVLTVIDLRPVVTVAAGTEVDVVRRLVEEAHRECYVAASLRTDVRVSAEVVVAR